jgi:hypothetical protein
MLAVLMAAAIFSLIVIVVLSNRNLPAWIVILQTIIPRGGIPRPGRRIGRAREAEQSRICQRVCVYRSSG